jgi:hypothetical protein
MKMRKIIKSKKGDISAPIITVLLIIASIAIATIVIAWMYGMGSTVSKQGNLVILGTPVIQATGSNSYTLYITLKNAGNVAVTINSIQIKVSATSVIQTTSINPTNTIDTGSTVSLTVTFTSTTPLPPQVNGLLITSAGIIPFSAISQ